MCVGSNMNLKRTHHLTYCSALARSSYSAKIFLQKRQRANLFHVSHFRTRPLGMKEFLLHFKSLLLSFTIPRLISLEVNLQWSSEQKMLDWVTPSLAMRWRTNITINYSKVTICWISKQLLDTLEKQFPPIKIKSHEWWSHKRKISSHLKLRLIIWRRGTCVAIISPVNQLRWCH